jgi:hypothetical protein
VQRETPQISGYAKELEALAEEQGISPVTNFDDLLGDFWPEEESVDDFIAAVQEWRREVRDPSS